MTKSIVIFISFILFYHSIYNRVIEILKTKLTGVLSQFPLMVWFLVGIPQNSRAAQIGLDEFKQTNKQQKQKKTQSWVGGRSWGRVCAIMIKTNCMEFL